MGKLPVLEHVAAFGGGAGSFLPESGAILRYLCRVLLPSPAAPFGHFYPHWDPAAAALVDAAVEWHFSSLRPGCSGAVWALVLARTVPRGGAERRAAAESPAAAAAALAALELALDALEGRSGSGPSTPTSASSPPPPPPPPSWLLPPGGGGDGGFLAGRSRVSIADLLVATELDQLRLLEAAPKGRGGGGAGGRGGGGGGGGGVSLGALLAPRPRVRAYLSRVREACGGPGHWDEVSSVLDRVVANLKKKEEKEEERRSGDSEGREQARL